MKLIIFLGCLIACVAIVCGARCAKQDDCYSDQCCVALAASQLPGKRAVCLRLNRERARCRPPDSKLDYYEGKFLGFCPCQEGLTCKPFRLRPGEKDQTRILNSLRCQRETATTAQKPSTRGDPATTKVNPDTGGDPATTKVNPDIGGDPATTQVNPDTGGDPATTTVVPETGEDPATPETGGDPVENGPGGEDVRDDDPDCEDWTHGC